MKKRSDYTKKLIKTLWIFRALNWLCLFLPVIIYVFYALFSGQVPIVGKVTVTFGVLISLILTAFNVIAQKRLRCPIWILLIGLYIAIKEYLLPLVIVLAVTSVLDDFFFTPVISRLTDRKRASETIDDRMGENVREEI